MNTKANRLTEIDVHSAMEAMIEEGEKPTALKLLRALERGSLTTITKFMNSFSSNQEDFKEALPPALVEVPREIGATGELLVKKIWADARALANHAIESQRAALVQAEADAETRISEAMEFSDVQAKQIEEMESLLDELKGMIAEKDECINALEADVKNLTLALNDASKKRDIAEEKLFLTQEILKKTEGDSEKLNNRLMDQQKKMDDKNEEIKELEKSKSKEINELNKINKSLDLQVNKQKMALDQQSNNIESLKQELKSCQKNCKESGELAAKLTGKLEVYEKIKHDAKPAFE